MCRQITDAELIRAFLNGEESALETLIHRHKDRIYTSIYVLVRDPYIAEDLFQDAFMRMIRTLRAGNYQEKGLFLPWAIRIAHNLCMDYFRKIRQRQVITLPDGTDLEDWIPGTSPDTMELMESREVSQSVREMIGDLPEEQREVVVLRLYGDLPFKEIARITGVSINTSLGRMRYALINLRRMVEERELVLR